MVLPIASVQLAIIRSLVLRAVRSALPDMLAPAEVQIQWFNASSERTAQADNRHVVCVHLALPAHVQTKQPLLHVMLAIGLLVSRATALHVQLAMNAPPTHTTALPHVTRAITH
jgi:hypothetical protein